MADSHISSVSVPFITPAWKLTPLAAARMGRWRLGLVAPPINLHLEAIIEWYLSQQTVFFGKVPLKLKSTASFSALFYDIPPKNKRHFQALAAPSAVHKQVESQVWGISFQWRVGENGLWLIFALFLDISWWDFRADSNLSIPEYLNDIKESSKQYLPASSDISVSYIIH